MAETETDGIAGYRARIRGARLRMSRIITKARDSRKVVEQVDADWPTARAKSSKRSLAVAMRQSGRVAKCTLEPRDATES